MDINQFHKKLSSAYKSSEFKGNIKSLVDVIQPAVEKARGETGDIVENAVNKNIEITVEGLKLSSPILKQGVLQGNLNIIGAYYDIDNGYVTFFKQHLNIGSNPNFNNIFRLNKKACGLPQNLADLENLEQGY